MIVGENTGSSYTLRRALAAFEDYLMEYTSVAQPTDDPVCSF
jgi:hypothetical protein